jgi:hypothetical protein
MNALMPLCLRLLSVVANTTAQSASCALVIQALVPFSTHSSPLSTAVVLAAPASLPLPVQQAHESQYTNISNAFAVQLSRIKDDGNYSRCSTGYTQHCYTPVVIERQLVLKQTVREQRAAGLRPH